MTPLKNRIFVKEEKIEKIGTIIVPVQAKPQTALRPQMAEVTAVGPEVKDKRIKVGVRVLMDHRASMMTWHEQLVMNEEDVLAVVIED